MSERELCGLDGGRPVRQLCVLVCRSFGGIDREAQLPLCCAKVILSFGAVAHHVVMIGCTCMLHLIDGFNDILVNRIKIVPGVDLCGQYRTCCKCRCESKCGNDFLHLDFLHPKYVFPFHTTK